TYSVRSREYALQNLYEAVKPFLAKTIEALTRETKDNLTNREILELAKMHFNPVLQTAMQKLGTITRNVAPIQAEAMKQMDNDPTFTSKIKDIIGEAKSIQEKEDKQSAIDFGQRMDPVHGELLLKIGKIKATSINTPAPAAIPAPVAPAATTPASSPRRQYYLVAFAVAATAFTYFAASSLAEYYVNYSRDIV
ncbi:MAG: hypothetical protein K1000chlam2_00782, partial [Chlamydiae bacterium]|nr:hypothetical protein [Chlamydiota bacterium]